MQNVVLIVHLLLALSLIGIVLLQRSEGGGGLMGGGGAATGRAPATPLGKVTWGVAIAFLVTSVALTVISASSGDRSVVSGVAGSGDAGAEVPASGTSGGLSGPGESLLPPSSAIGDAPAVPPRAD